MAIIQKINYAGAFMNAFQQAGRYGGVNDNFTYQGLKILFDYLKDLSEDTGEDIELDVIALCCEYAESEVDSIIRDYNINMSDLDTEGMDEDDINEAKMDIVREWLNDNTIICGEYDGNFVYCSSF